METRKKLNKEFFTQDFAKEQSYGDILEAYKHMASHYASIENVIAVLSDLRTRMSYLYYGNFARTLGLKKDQPEDTVASIWEEEIFQLIHPDDLADKHAQELRFYHFFKHQPRKHRSDYYLMSKLRMKNASNHFIPVLHRMFYVSAPCNDNLWLALCLYGPLLLDLPAPCITVNSANGQITLLDNQNQGPILSDRETEILGLIHKGLASKEIAALLSISVNTVSRHRQSILSKLQVKNSIEACRIAKCLRILQ